MSTLYAGFFDELVKLGALDGASVKRFLGFAPTENEKAQRAARLKKEMGGQLAISGGAGLLGSAALTASLPDAGHEIVGGQRFFHGTNNSAAESIRRYGFDPSRGGSGGADAEGSDDFRVQSKNKVHVSTSKREARTFADMLERRALGEKPDYLASGLRVYGHKGTTLSGALPYEDFKSKFEVDTSMPALYKPTAFRTSEHIKPDVLKNDLKSIAALRLKNPSSLLNYVKSNPGRVAHGIGHIAAIPALGYGGYKVLNTGMKMHRDARDELKKLDAEKGSKLGAVSPEQARRSLDRLDALEQNKPTIGQVARYGALGAGAGALSKGVSSAIESGKLPSGRTLLGAGAAGAIGMGAVPLIRNALDKHVEKKNLRNFMAQGA